LNISTDKVFTVLTLVIPVYRNEGSIPDLLDAVGSLHHNLNGEMETVFVVDGIPDRCYEILRAALPEKLFPSKLVLLSKNFGSFQAIRVGLQLGSGDRFAVMAADLQEPPELVLEMDRALREELIDVIVGVRDGRKDPLLSRIPAQIFWGLYRRYVVREIPPGGVDVFGCNRHFRDTLLQLDEGHSSLIAQIFWLGFRRKCISYVRQSRQHGKSAWTLHKKINYLMDSIFAFTDLPIRLLIRIGGSGAFLAGLLGVAVLTAKLLGMITVPGYAITMLAITFIGAVNLFGLGIVGSYAWRAYENTKGRPLAVVLSNECFDMKEKSKGLG
jgi:glycosyltransferase involved in cell wall biosynthesis